MGKRKTEQRIKAIELHKQGFSRRQIAERVGDFTNRDFQGDKLLNGLVCALIPLRRG